VQFASDFQISIRLEIDQTVESISSQGVPAQLGDGTIKKDDTTAAVPINETFKAGLMPGLLVMVVLRGSPEVKHFTVVRQAQGEAISKAK